MLNKSKYYGSFQCFYFLAYHDDVRTKLLLLQLKAFLPANTVALIDWRDVDDDAAQERWSHYTPLTSTTRRGLCELTSKMNCNDVTDEWISQQMSADTVTAYWEKLAWNYCRCALKQRGRNVFLKGAFISHDHRELAVLLTPSDDEDDGDAECVESVDVQLKICRVFGLPLVFRAEWRTDVQHSRRAVLSYHLEAQTGRASLLRVIWLDRQTQGAAFRQQLLLVCCS